MTTPNWEKRFDDMCSHESPIGFCFGPDWHDVDVKAIKSFIRQTLISTLEEVKEGLNEKLKILNAFKCVSEYEAGHLDGTANGLHVSIELIQSRIDELKK